jgi:nicotinate phosphoribosyltransferase
MELSLSLDQLQSAFVLWKHRLADREAAFHVVLRSISKGPLVLSGVEESLDRVEDFGISAKMTVLTEHSGLPAQFCEFLGGIKAECDVYAAKDGSAVLPGEPVIRVQGPFLQAFLISARIRGVLAEHTSVASYVAEFRKVAGPGALVAASPESPKLMRAAIIGGATHTLRPEHARTLGVGVVASADPFVLRMFPSRLDGYAAIVRDSQERCTLPLPGSADAADVRDAVMAAITASRLKKEVCLRFFGAPSLETLRTAREALNAAGMNESVVVTPPPSEGVPPGGMHRVVWDLGEASGHQLQVQAECFLGAIKREDGVWNHITRGFVDDPSRVSVPGLLQVKRIQEAGVVTDVVVDEIFSPPAPGEDVLEQLVQHGRRMYGEESVQSSRDRVRPEVAGFTVDPVLASLQESILESEERTRR